MAYLGTLGGAIFMNAGAYNGQMKDVVLETKYIDKNLKIKKLKKEEHEFEYRTSFFSKNKDNIIIYTKLKLKKAKQENIKEKMEEFLKSRKEKQPLEMPNAGSIFKRENEYIPAQLIQECGIKGYNINDAYISEKHCGFIVNKGDAKAKDVIELIDYIKAKVKEKFNIELKTEIEILGE